MEKINLNRKKFRARKNSKNDEICGATIFSYFQNGEIFWGKYFSGKIKFRTLMDHWKNGAAEFFYQHFNCENEFRTDRCVSTPEILTNGKIRFYEKWQWTAGRNGAGKSIIEEI